MTARPAEFRDTVARARWLAPVTIVLGSLVTIVPIVAIVPVLPPFGLMLLMAWRLRRPDVFRSWSPIPFGLFDDLVSGQPFGSAMMLWTLCFLVLEVIESRLVWRDFWQDWLIAGGAVVLCLAAGRLLASPLRSAVGTPVLLQMAVAVALYPLAAALCARLDPRPKAA